MLPRRTPLAVATSSGDLAGHRFDADAEAGRLLVLCPPEARDRALATLDGVPADIVPVPLGAAADGRLSGDDVIDALGRHGLTSVVCEGGPALAAALLAAGRVDELCLTTSPEPRHAPDAPRAGGLRDPRAHAPRAAARGRRPPHVRPVGRRPRLMPWSRAHRPEPTGVAPGGRDRGT
ncbi:dihydrofolate reductase family protein [Clavibacter tessellarius]|uniref:dihydrofolate reductase family protein n=1 Tax=Clavibacter tessellarius TaxID=31965 RepID=UPI0032530513